MLFPSASMDEDGISIIIPEMFVTLQPTLARINHFQICKSFLLFHCAQHNYINSLDNTHYMAPLKTLNTVPY